MRRMYSENQIKNMIENSPSEVVKALKGQDISVEGITSKGNVAISGDLTANSIIENMPEGYGFVKSEANYVEYNYAGIVKNGNKITMVLDFSINKPEGNTDSSVLIGSFRIPSSIGAKIIPNPLSQVGAKTVPMFRNNYTFTNLAVSVSKSSSINLQAYMYGLPNLSNEVLYCGRLELTFLLSENLVPQE